jgi:hypothetical protein
MNERRDHYLAPVTDNDTESVLDEAIDSLARLRAMGGRGNAGVDLHLLTSLIDEATRRLSGAVARARGQDYSWAEIADLLGVTRRVRGSATPGEPTTTRRRSRTGRERRGEAISRERSRAKSARHFDAFDGELQCLQTIDQAPRRR